MIKEYARFQNNIIRSVTVSLSLRISNLFVSNIAHPKCKVSRTPTSLYNMEVPQNNNISNGGCKQVF